MGEDFIIYIVSCPKDKELEFSKTKNYIKNNIKTIRAIKDFDENIDTTLTNEELIAQLINAVETVESGWKGDSRECAFAEHKGDRLMITGGMSWGDDPTDTFSSLCFLENANLLKMIGFDVM